MKKSFIWFSLIYILIFNSSCTTSNNIQETSKATKIESVNTAGINNDVIVQSNDYDLNGDGINEQIQLEFIFEYEQSTTCMVTINNTSRQINIAGDQWFQPKLVIVDLDKSDQKQEIAISYSGDGEVSFTTFIGYDEKPYIIGTIPGFTAQARPIEFNDYGNDNIIQIDGSGKIYTTTQSDVLLSWNIKQLYLFHDQQLYLVKEDVYEAYQPHSVEVLQDFTVYTQKSADASAHVLKQGEKITLLGTDNAFWVQCMDENNTIYWIQMSPNIEGYANAIQDFGDGAEYLYPLQYYS